MDLILITFCRFDFYVVKVSVQTANYIQFESLYPSKGIKGDYFCEEVNFYDESSIPTINKFVTSVIEGYDSFGRCATSFTKFIEDNMENNDRNLLTSLAEKYISVNYRHIDFQFFSKITMGNFIEMHVNYFLTQSFPFEDLFVCDSELKIVERCMNLVIEQNVTEVVLVKFHDDIYAGADLCKKLNLSESHFPEEQLLQEMLVCYYSGPRLDNDKNPFEYQYFFEERFSKFDEQKKLGLYMISNSSKELFLYNKCLTKFWLTR